MYTIFGSQCENLNILHEHRHVSILTRTLSFVVDIMDRASVVMDGGAGGGVQGPNPSSSAST